MPGRARAGRADHVGVGCSRGGGAAGARTAARAAQQRGAARNAADAAALAGAAEGLEAAREVAAENGAQLIGWRAQGRDVWVVVTLGDARAEAKARRDR